MHRYLAKRKTRFLSDDLYSSELEIGMEENINIAFPKTNRSHCAANDQSSPISDLWKYRMESIENVKNSIPCLFLQAGKLTDTILVYFHGNGEDILGCHAFLSNMSQNIQVSILAMEYPGYSLH